MMRDRPLINPKKRFLMAAQVTQAGRPDRIDFAAEMPEFGEDEGALTAWCRDQARQCGGRYYVFEVRPVRRITKKKNKLIG